jgi:hypothetical protein
MFRVSQASLSILAVIIESRPAWRLRLTNTTLLISNSNEFAVRHVQMILKTATDL